MILVVDDCAHGPTSLCHVIPEHGCICQCVDSGSKALKVIRAHPREQPLLVILGKLTPEMDRLSVLKAIRKDPLIGDTVVIIYSERYNMASRERALALGATGYLSNGKIIGSGVDSLVSRILLWYENLGGIRHLHSAQSTSSHRTSKVTSLLSPTSR